MRKAMAKLIKVGIYGVIVLLRAAKKKSKCAFEARKRHKFTNSVNLFFILILSNFSNHNLYSKVLQLISHFSLIISIFKVYKCIFFPEQRKLTGGEARQAGLNYGRFGCASWARARTDFRA